MSTFEWNKIAGSILLALLVIKVIDIAGDAMPHAKAPAKHAYPIEGVAQAQPAGGEAKEAKKAAPEVPAIGPLLAKASVDDGAKSARKCAICHSFDKGGPNKVGPALWGVVGGDIAQGSFAYSPTLKGLDGNWDFEKLNKFLHDPKGFAPGTKMAFAGVKNDAERAALIAYLRSRADNPVPLP